MRQLTLIQLKRYAVMDALHRFTVVRFKGRSERLMPLHKLPERLLQPRSSVRQFQHSRHIVADTAVFKLLEHIHPFLRRRHRVGVLFCAG